ncbi:MAG: hypothetical protein C5S48_01790 [Candidatus Methanogaster sp.]|nr:MAG: hypothetical protein C5S48_01790 [ANME-2 cluster archaeon]
METVTMEARLTLKLLEELESLIKEEWRANKSEPIKR